MRSLGFLVWGLLAAALLGCTMADASGPRKLPGGCFSYLDVVPGTLGVDSADTGDLTGNEYTACASIANDSTVTWTSRNTAIATVASSGTTTATVSGIASGAVYIVGAVGSHADSSLITVTGPPPPPPVDTAQVSAGPDVSGAVNTAIALTGHVPVGWTSFYRKISGPGSARLSTAGFFSGYEPGNTSEWTAAVPGCSSMPGSIVGHGSVTTGAHLSGSYGYHFYNDGLGSGIDGFSSKMVRWCHDYPTAVYQASLYWPVGYNLGSSPDIVNIFQWKEVTSPYNPCFLLGVVRPVDGSGQDDLILYDWNAGAVRRGPKVPKGQWFTLSAIQSTGHGTSGTLKVFLGDSLLWNVTGNTSGGSYNTYWMWGIGNYAPVGVGHYVDGDDASISRADLGSLASPTVTATVAGVYVFRLVGSSGSTVLTDDVTITVAP